MRLCLTLDHRFLQTPDGRVWTVTQCPYAFYAEYLQVFESVRVIARTFPVPEVRPEFIPVEGRGVELYPVTSYKGPVEYLRKRSAVQRSLRGAVPNDAAVIFRVPSQVANVVEKSIRKRKHPFAVDVVADPYDVLSPSANPHPIAPIARTYFTRLLQDFARRAVAVSYVTQNYLQQRYPGRPDAFYVPPIGAVAAQTKPDDVRQQYIVGVSDVNLPEEVFNSTPRTALRQPGTLRVLFVGTLGSLYKGPDTLIRAVALAAADGVRLEVRFAGSGKQMEKLQALCHQLGVGNQVCFLGDVPAGGPIREEIDRADVFVLPSRAEGVPRAMLEAMARSLPCIGSHVGGIPELLPEEDRVRPDDPQALSFKLKQIYSDRGRLQHMSMRCFRVSRNYATEVLRARRRAFLEAVHHRTRSRLASGEAKSSYVS